MGQTTKINQSEFVQKAEEMERIARDLWGTDFQSHLKNFITTPDKSAYLSRTVPSTS